jgi:hypothetical protein
MTHDFYVRAVETIIDTITVLDANGGVDPGTGLGAGGLVDAGS